MYKKDIIKKRRNFIKQYSVLALVVVCLIASGICLLTKTIIIPYNLENYRYLFSALIQVVGGILALVVSSILIAMQLLNNKSSRMMKYFPKEQYMKFSISTLLIIALDVVALLALNQRISLILEILLPWIVVLNMLVLYVIISLINSLIYISSTRAQIAKLLIEAHKAASSDNWSEILYAFEEIFCSGIKNGEGGNISEYQQCMLMILDTMEKRHDTGNIKELQYPLRKLPGICGHLVAIILDNEMSGHLYRFGDILRRISEVSDSVIEGANIELALTVKSISKLCLDRMCINEFCDMCAQFICSEDEAKGEETLLLSIQYIADQVSSHPDKESSAYVLSRITTNIQQLLQNKDFSMNIEAKKIVDSIAQQAELLAILDSRGHSVANQIAEMKKLTADGKQ